MKRFTLTMMGLLMLLGGVKAEDINPSTGNLNENVGFEGSDKIIMVFHDNNPRYSLIGSTTWAENIPSGKKHVFTLKVTTDGIQSGDKLSKLYIVALNNIKKDNENKLKGADNFNSNNTFKDEIIVASDNVTITTDEEYTLTIEISDNQTYEAIALYTDNSNWHKIKVNSFTRTEVDDVPAVAAPTISPASSTYDGDLSVTITKGDGNDKVVYSVSGATTGNVTNAEFTENSKPLDLTGTGTITVTATGYNGVNASSPVTNTYTYGVPSGKTSASITYYALSGVLMEDGTSRAFYDFEDGVTPGAHNSGNPLRVSKNFTGGTSNLSIVDCDADHTSATGSTKCLKIDFSGKGETQNYYDSQIDLFFKEALTQGHTYYVHFWTKAKTRVNDKANTKVEFQHNGADDGKWDRSHINSDVDYDTSWHEYMYAIQPSRDDATMMCFDLGTVRNNVLYIDDIAVFDATSGTTPVEFTSRLGSAVIAASAFDNYAVGDYVNLNLTGTPTEIAYKEHAANDETAISNYPSYTALTQTDGNWLIPVTAGMKTNGLTIKGHDMTLNSVDIYKKMAISEATNNTISSKEDHVVVELTRSLVAENWNTVCLPFALTSAQATQLFGSGYQLAEFTSVSGTTMKFTTAASFEAGVPYLVKPTINVSNESPIVLVDVNITAKTPQTVPPIDGYSFVGNFTQKTFSSSECNSSLFVATGNELMKPYENSTLKSLRCYFTVPSGSIATARRFTIDDEEGETTGINAVHGEGFMVNGYYNLNGQRVAKPTKGLFIVNGKKVVIK